MARAASKPPATTPETAVAVRGITTIHHALDSERARAAIAKALDGANPDRVIAAAKAYLRTAERPEDILECDPNTFVLACIDAATDGLLPDGKDGYLVPRKGRVKWQPSWRGLVRLARRAAAVKSLHAEVVYEAEVRKGAFLIDLGLARTLRHKPWWTVGIRKEERGPIVAAYCTWQIEGCDPDFELVDRERLDTARAYSGNPYKPDEPSKAWLQHEASMSKKTAIRVAIEGRRLELPDAVREVMERAIDRDRDDGGATVTQLPSEHAAPTGDTRQGWNGGTSAADIRARGPKKNGTPPVDTTAREEAPAQGELPTREPGEDIDDEGGKAEAP